MNVIDNFFKAKNLFLKIFQQSALTISVLLYDIYKHQTRSQECSLALNAFQYFNRDKKKAEIHFYKM